MIAKMDQGGVRPSAEEERLRASSFLRACRREPSAVTPIWLMRQAGRYLPEYRAARKERSIFELIENPQAAAEITLQPLARFDLDAAIVFSDILPPLRAMGFAISFSATDGPIVENPISRTKEIDLLAVPPAEEHLGATFETIRIVRRELAPRGIPLIGFAGAPFTLASYAIEGGGSKSYAKTKRLMYGEPAAWKRLMTKLASYQTDYLLAQARAGASVVQLFDSWAGVALGKADYERYVLPYNSRVFGALKAAGVTSINFSTGTAGYLDRVASAGGEVIGVDWRLPLSASWERIGFDRSIQGNLDPGALLAPWRELRPRIDEVLHEAEGRPGHIFNLGHGVLPETPPENVKRLVDYVHERSSSAPFPTRSDRDHGAAQ